MLPQTHEKLTACFVPSKKNTMFYQLSAKAIMGSSCLDSSGLDSHSPTRSHWAPIVPCTMFLCICWRFRIYQILSEGAELPVSWEILLSKHSWAALRCQSIWKSCGSGDAYRVSTNASGLRGIQEMPHWCCPYTKTH